MAYVINADVCANCGACADECPVGAIHSADNHYTIDQDYCAGCGTCAPTCPTGAIVYE